MIEQKRILFYPILATGHLNVCVSVAKVLLNTFSNVECYFVVDEPYADKLRKLDHRFKFGIYEYDKKEEANRLVDMIDKFEIVLENPNLVDRLNSTWSMFMEDIPLIAEIDRKAEEKMKEINPHILICDQPFYFPSMLKYPCAFIVSCNPLAIGLDGYPQMGSDARCDEHEKIKNFAEESKPTKKFVVEAMRKFFRLRGMEMPEKLAAVQPISDHFSIYSYPLELDYFDSETQKKYNLWQIDSPLIPERIPPKFELPKHFETLPGKVIYVSLGSLFSAYVSKIQKMVDILDKLPHKFIVSKGPNGDKLKFPSNKFVGSNFVNQLAVLQSCDLMISHGGNNTFVECFHFGVPQIISGVVYDQINNQTRVIEKNLGYSLDLMHYTEDDLINTVNKAINDKEMRMKLAKISNRIQKDDTINKVATKIMDHVNTL